MPSRDPTGLAWAIGLAGALGAVAPMAGADVARGETLADAVALAYQSNPTLQAERAQLRALDETYVQARVGFRPQLSGSAEADYAKGPQVQNGVVGVSGPQGADAATLNLEQPLFNGGLSSAQVRASMSEILAERQRLRQTEASVLRSVVQAYIDVRRDSQALAIAQGNLKELQRQLADTQAHVDVGELTRTDLAQAQARLAGARSQLSGARAQLAISRSAYLAQVGQNPGVLAEEPPLPGLPRTLEEALEAAGRNNPGVGAADYAERAGAARVSAAKAGFRPTIALRGSYGVDGVIGPLNGGGFNQGPGRYAEVATASIVITQPLFTGGLQSSRVRQAAEAETRELIALDSARRQAVQQVSQAWSQLRAADEEVASSQDQVAADEIALQGVHLDREAGQRTTLDELNAEQELESARLALNGANRDRYLARATLLAAMGRLEVRALAPNQKLYDPETSFNAVRREGAVPWEGLVEGLDNLGGPHEPLRAPQDPVALPKPAPEPADSP